MFRGRGAVPSVGGGQGNNRWNFGKNNNDDNEDTISHYHTYIHYWSRRSRYYGRRYDEKFVAMSMGVTIFLVTICIAIFILAYKPSFIDPIEKIKTTYLNCKIFFAMMLAIIVGIASYFSKTKQTLIKNLSVLVLITTIVSITFSGIKLSLDSTYNEEKFGELYETSEVKQNEEPTKKKVISVNIDGLKVKEAKQNYIDENILAYKFFSYKSTAITVLYAIIIIFNLAMIIRLIKRQEKNDRLNKDDIILFDEEENIKI